MGREKNEIQLALKCCSEEPPCSKMDPSTKSCNNETMTVHVPVSTSSESLYNRLKKKKSSENTAPGGNNRGQSRLQYNLDACCFCNWQEALDNMSHAWITGKKEFATWEIEPWTFVSSYWLHHWGDMVSIHLLTSRGNDITCPELICFSLLKMVKTLNSFEKNSKIHSQTLWWSLIKHLAKWKMYIQ